MRPPLFIPLERSVALDFMHSLSSSFQIDIDLLSIDLQLVFLRHSTHVYVLQAFRAKQHFLVRTQSNLDPDIDVPLCVLSFDSETTYPGKYF